MKHFFITILIFLLSAGPAFADTFIVTNNGNNGTGSFTDAITKAAANGTNTVDSILFNITDISRAGRTITITDTLPDLSSNLIIDASTQPGSNIGKSDAKVELLLNTIRTKWFYFLKFTNATNVQVYGLFFYKDFETIFNPNQTYSSGIMFKYCDHIIIGKPGKGNYFRGLSRGIDNARSYPDEQYKRNSSDITIQSNVFGHNENGEAIIQDAPGSAHFVDWIAFAIYCINSVDIRIGGDSQAEGNHFFAEKLDIRSELPDNGFLIFRNNDTDIKIGGDYLDPTNASNSTSIIFGGFHDWPNKVDYQMDIRNNIINGGLQVIYNYGFTRVQGNILYSSNNTYGGTTFRPKLIITLCGGGGIIGGELPQEQNEVFTQQPVTQSMDWNGGFLPKGIVVESSPKIAIVKNKLHCSSVYGSAIYVQNSNEPDIRIDFTGVNIVRGKATPNCKIEVFLDDDCWACEGIAYLGSTVSNADSSWSFTGNFSGTVIATAAKADSSTSGYTEPLFRLDTVKVDYPSCGLKNGSVKGIYGLVNSDNVEWHKLTFPSTYPYIKDSLVSTTLDLVNADAGYYYFVAKLGQTCHSASFYITLKDYTPIIDESSATATNPSCGLFNGSIGSVRVTNGDLAHYQWINEQGLPISGGNYDNSNNVYINALPAGKYRLVATDNKNGCADTSNVFTLTNQSGPTVDINNANITYARCGLSNGSITGISVMNGSGNQFVQWTDSLGNIVGNNFDLTNVPEGKYRLKYKDQSNCDTIITSFFAVPDTTIISVDVSTAVVTPAGCTIKNGSITNVTVTNATSFTWKNIHLSTNSIVGNALDIYNLPEGVYQLTLSNQHGCSKLVNDISIPQANFDNIRVTSFIIRNAGCNKPNGEIKIDQFSKDIQGYSFFWKDSIRNTVYNNSSLLNIPKGVYMLFAIDKNGCEGKIFSAFVDSLPAPSLNESSLALTNDVCNRKQGSITGLSPKDFSGNIIYKWTDQGNTVIGNGLNLQNINAGVYTLQLTDAANCSITSRPFAVGNDNTAEPDPQYEDLIVPRNTPATLKVKNFMQGKYILYADAAATQELQQNATGIFTTAPVSEDKILYVKYVTGDCSSSPVTVRITAVDDSYFAIPKAFTPNNDGNNDRFRIIVIGYIQLHRFIIYNRYGEAVFATSTINDTWDGMYKGKAAIPGVYTWMAEGKNIQGRTVQAKGTVVLIR